MYNPLQRVDDAFRKHSCGESFRRRKIHPVLSWFELAAFISFLPGMFFWLYAFALSAAATYAVHESEKQRYGLAVFTLCFFNLLPAIFCTLDLVHGYSHKSAGIAVIYGLLAIWGLYGIYLQKRFNK